MTSNDEEQPFERINLYGDLSYKKQLWGQLWDLANMSQELGEGHDIMYTRLQYIHIVLNFISLGLVSVATILFGTDYEEDHRTAIILMNIFGALGKVFEYVVGLEERLRQHRISGNNYKYASMEIQRLMKIKRGTTELKEGVDIVSNFINMYEQSAPTIPKKLVRIKTERKPLPQVPLSPGMEDKRIEVAWKRSYPNITSNKDLLLYYNEERNVGHFRIHVDGEITRVDENYCRIIGETAREVVGMSSFQWTSYIYKEDAFDVFHKLEDCLKDQTPFYHKFRFYLNNHKLNYIVCEAYPLYARNGKFSGFEGVVIQISEDIWDNLDIN